MKLRGQILRRRVELGGDGDEAERDFTGPEGAHFDFPERCECESLGLRGRGHAKRERCQRRRKGLDPIERETKPEPATEKVSSPDRLATYRAKRHFEVTPEPGSSQDEGHEEKKTAAADARKPGEALAFVVQKHDARRLHYDVRLEVDGAMVSWAVPKGPSYDPAVRRLAVQTEDHPMEYNAFEGRIPDGEYGAGDVLIWDRGTYETVPPGQQRAMLDKGHLHVRLFGEKLVGDWHFIRTNRSPGDDGAGKAGKAQWLLFKAKDRRANPAYDVVAERPESVVSGQAGDARPAARRRVRRGQERARAHRVRRRARCSRPPTCRSRDGDGWLFEIKYDGYRLVACKAGDDVRLYTRARHDWTDRFRPIAQGVAHAAGARVRRRRRGVRGRRRRAARRSARSRSGSRRPPSASPKPATSSSPSFDLLWLDGRDLRARAHRGAARAAREARSRAGAPHLLSRARSRASSTTSWAPPRQAGLEGLVAKRKGSPYVVGPLAATGSSCGSTSARSARSSDAFRWPARRDDVGALLLAVVEPARPGVLVFAGRVGTGFDARMRRDLGARLNERLAEGPSVEGAPGIKDARWVTPALVCECAFAEWTREGSMRHPRFLGMREDKTPLECLREDLVQSAPAPDVGRSRRGWPPRPPRRVATARSSPIPTRCSSRATASPSARSGTTTRRSPR